MATAAPTNLASLLQAYLTNQGIAGNAAPNLTTLAQNAPSYSIDTPTISSGAAGTPIDYSGLTSYYSDPENSNYLDDPVLLQQEANDTTANQNADSSALKAREQLLAQLGDSGLASSVLGSSDPTLGAISDDPNTSTSILARLARAYQTTKDTNDDQLNKGNLFYSSDRADVLNDAAKDYTTSQADAIASAQSGLDNISAQLANVKNQSSQADQQALADAYARYLAAVNAHPASAAPPTEPSNFGAGGNVTAPGYGTVQPGDTIDANGDTAPSNIGDYPYLNPSDSAQVYTPVSVGGTTSFEPKPTAANFSPLGQYLSTPAPAKSTLTLTPAETAARNKKQLAY